MSIWEERSKVEAARRAFVKEATEEYDRTVYYPAMKSLRKRCEAEGHTAGPFHDNGLGWSWFYCTKCAGRVNITGPDGTEETTP